MGSASTRGGGIAGPSRRRLGQRRLPDRDASPAPRVKKQFYGSIDLDAFQAKSSSPTWWTRWSSSSPCARVCG